jgi:hypothetical protein
MTEAIRETDGKLFFRKVNIIKILFAFTGPEKHRF